MTLADVNLAALLPAVILVLTGMVIMVTDPFSGPGHKSRLMWLGVAGIVAAGLGLGPMSDSRGTWYSGLWQVDDFSLFFHSTVLLAAALTLLASMGYLRRERLPSSEFAALILFATTGALLMVGAAELILIFVGIEILSIGSYILVGYKHHELRSNESALKYFLLGSFASAFFLYGIALMFGAAESTHLTMIREAVLTGRAPSGLVFMGSALMIVGLCFKVALAPFHVWAPDVYQGAPTPVTAFLSVCPKAAGFAVLIRILFTALPDIEGQWIWALWVLAALTMIVGNLVAIVQRDIKRMLAYSSIAHAGYVGVALASSPRGAAAAMFYLLAYTAMTLGAFAIVARVSRTGDARVSIEDYRGLGWKRPGIAALLALFLLSLAGFPATAGFAGKFFIFQTAVQSGLTGLTILGVLTTVVSFYYYLYVIVQMYMRDPVDEFAEVSLGASTSAVLLVTAALTLYLGIFPETVLEWAARSADSILIR